jgi:hypothetical protein
MIKAGRYELDEESMGRIYQHIVSNPKTKSWAVITASRGENTPAENARKNKELENDLRKMGLGFVHADGMWRECKNQSIEYKDCPEELKVPSEEKVLFIPNIPKDKAVELGKKYQQDSVLYADEETKAKGEATFIDSKSGEEFNIGKFTPGKVAQGYTKMKGDKVFTFLQPGEKGEKPKEQPKKNDMKLKSLVPKGVLDKMVKNPETGNMIKLKSALKKDKTSPVYRTAVGMVKQSKK